MLSAIVRVGDDAAGIEKTLRLGQYLSQTAAALLATKGSHQAYYQFSLARRYFRLLKWHESFAFAYEYVNGTMGLLEFFQVSKWSLLGIYYFVEMLDITNAMGITTHGWGPFLEYEASRFWLLSIAASIMVSLCQLLFTPPLRPGSKDNEKIMTEPSIPSAKIYRQLIVDCADIVIPAAGIGWIDLDEVYIGLAGTLSTVIAGQQLWARIQSRTALISSPDMPGVQPDTVAVTDKIDGSKAAGGMGKSS